MRLVGGIADGATARRQEGLGDGEPEAGTLHVLMLGAAPETVADALHFLCGQARAPVGDDDRDVITTGGDRDEDLFVGRGELQGVVDDGVEGARQCDGVRPGRHGGRAVRPEPYSFLLGDQPPGRDAFRGERAYVRELQVCRGVFGQRQVEQVVQNLREAFALRAYGGDLLVALGEFEREELDPQQQRGKGLRS